MIRQLDIRNYAIIEQLSLTFSNKLNILTGETGSGKSIILGAFGLILGNRADSKVLLDKGKKCIVEATFDISVYDLKDFFNTQDLDYENQVLIRREINSSGKSRAFINDTPVKLTQLKELTSHLVDLHQQFENQGINDTQEQLRMLDSLADNHKLLREYQSHFKKYKILVERRDRLRATHQNATKQRDFIQFQLDELLELDIDLLKDKELEVKLRQMDHAQDIIKNMGNLSFSLENSEQSIISMLSVIQQQIDETSRFHSGIKEISDRLESNKIELRDIADEAAQIAESLHVDAEEIAASRERLDKINLLLHKHQLQDLDSLHVLQQKFENELSSYDNIEDQLEVTQIAINNAKVKAKEKAEQLHRRRHEARPNFERDVNKLLGSLKMEYAHFKIDIAPSSDLHQQGQDRVTFLFAPNRGSEHRMIKEVASGGELSRLSLITKSLVAGSLKLPTLIFDEIDSGVSGDIAQKMGNILQGLSKKHQVISITHSPQVASRADSHFKVFKRLEGKVTKAKILALDPQERIIEIATMLSSSPPSSTAIASAKELIKST